MIRFVLFDLDNTLYPQSSGLWEAIGDRINLYMMERLGMHPTEVSRKRDDFLRAFGTTLSALRHYYGIDPDEFLSFVHDLPLANYIGYDPGLDRMLARTSLGKVIFTNADAPHARRVLARLGIIRHFERIIDIHALEFINKPDRRAYLKALEYISARPEECVFVEDSLINIRPARCMGMVTVLVRDSNAADGADHHIRDIMELEPILESLV
ncbi:MAG TPA: pyrimidine 5'-nucleotidase [Acidobacteriota bacterium]|nr:pyrimidine 5'-nucleotidase [Acidobacteriota bacterium]